MIGGRALAGIAGLNPAWGTDACVVLYSKDKGTSQDNKEKETSIQKERGREKL